MGIDRDVEDACLVSIASKERDGNGYNLFFAVWDAETFFVGHGRWWGKMEDVALTVRTEGVCLVFMRAGTAVCGGTENWWSVGLLVEVLAEETVVRACFARGVQGYDDSVDDFSSRDIMARCGT